MISGGQNPPFFMTKELERHCVKLLPPETNVVVFGQPRRLHNLSVHNELFVLVPSDTYVAPENPRITVVPTSFDKRSKQFDIESLKYYLAQLPRKNISAVLIDGHLFGGNWHFELLDEIAPWFSFVPHWILRKVEDSLSTKHFLRNVEVRYGRQTSHLSEKSLKTKTVILTNPHLLQ